MADNIRSIPSVMDGLKPGQRKVLFSCFKRNLKSEIKVAQLVGYVSEQSAYHHGEQSLCATIVNMAQDFVGANNINLLLPLGSFGSRLQGGKDAASPRYIFTNLNPLTRLIFSELDDPILNYLDEDNMKIEPEYYVPILPMVLVNGAEGIGTGWSTNIPNFYPIDIINNIRKLMKKQEMVEMTPYYRNFRGKITTQGSGKYLVEGIVEEISDNTLEILELPIGTWTQTYKEYLETLLQNGVIKDYKEYHTEKKVNFLISYIKKFASKTSTVITTSNMVCFNPEGKIKRYSSPLAIIEDFYLSRLKYYTIRKEYRLKAIKEELNVLENRVRFIQYVITDKLIINNRSNSAIIKDLEANEFDRRDNYEYLLGMRISSLTKEKIEKLNLEHDSKRQEYEILLKKSVYDLWNEDLDKFEEAYLKVVKEEAKDYDAEISKKAKKMPKKVNLKTPLSAESSSSKAKKTEKSKLVSENPSKSKKRDLSEEKDKEKSKKVKVDVEKQRLSATVLDSDSSSEENPWDKYKNI